MLRVWLARVTLLGEERDVTCMRGRVEESMLTSWAAVCSTELDTQPFPTTREEISLLLEPEQIDCVAEPEPKLRTAAPAPFYLPQT